MDKITITTKQAYNIITYILRNYRKKEDRIKQIEKALEQIELKIKEDVLIVRKEFEKIRYMDSPYSIYEQCKYDIEPITTKESERCKTEIRNLVPMKQELLVFLDHLQKGKPLLFHIPEKGFKNY